MSMVKFSSKQIWIWFVFNTLHYLPVCMHWTRQTYSTGSLRPPWHPM